MSSICILIPAYQPTETLLTLVSDLRAQCDHAIVVVNDGSDSDKQPIFEQLGTQAGVTVLQHVRNLGKGAALKTGFRHAIAQHAVGVITADADGQHLPTDIVKLAHQFEQTPQDLHLGVRAFDQSVPLRSRFGNIVTAKVMRWLGRINLSDTQTGLRAVPQRLLSHMLKAKQDDYAFETDMLLQTRQLGIHIQEMPIETVYIDDNASSHFRPIMDSLKIYWVFFRYLCIAMLSACLDFTLFALMHYFGSSILASVWTARLFSGMFNFLFNRQVVFRADVSMFYSGFSYIVLMLLNIYMSYALIHGFVALGMNVYASKVVGDIILFAVNFAVQHWVIFRVKS